jgi:hypothetical protein
MIKISKHKVAYEMANTSKEADVVARRYAATYANHLMKCLVFGKSAQAYNKWLNELLSYFRDVFSQKVRYGTKVKVAINFNSAHEFFYELYMPKDFLRGTYTYTVELNEEYTPCIEFEDLYEGFWDRYEEFERRTYQKAAIDKNLTKSYLEECIDFLREGVDED